MYALEFTGKAFKELAVIDRPRQLLIKKKLAVLAENPEALQNDIKPLKGKQFQGLQRLRVGDYRVIFQKNEEKIVILVVRVGHRREVY